MPDFATIYAQHAHEYDQLVSREDHQGNLLRALRQIAPLHGRHVAELGAGTGRLTRTLAPWVRRVTATDRSAHMLGYARRRLAELGIDNVDLAIADNGALPLRDGTADLAVAGWSFGHATAWSPHTWRVVIGGALDEMRRVLRPGGTAILIETLGTGRETPAPPSEELAAYYRWLERDLGWRSTWVRTDYRFASAAESDQLTSFFFGSPARSFPTPDGRATVPECTGIWWTSR